MKAKLIAAAAALLITACFPGVNNAYSADKTTHTVIVKTTDNVELGRLTVADGNAPDLSRIDLSKLPAHPNDYTEQRFSQWLPYPEVITADTVIYALTQKMSISCKSEPSKTEYYAQKGMIDLTGLKVTITSETQIPDKQDDGTYGIKVERAVTDITDMCSTSPADLKEAFGSGKTNVTVSVYPIQQKAICQFNITYFAGLGDIDGNNSIDAADSSAVLSVYSKESTGENPNISEEIRKRCDVDRNGSINAADASAILRYYSVCSTSSTEVTWDEYFRMIE